MSAKLDRAEWDFSAVPDDELKWCFLWEYKRETAPAQNKHAFAYCPETAWQNLDGLSKMGVQSRFMENWDDRPGDVDPVRELQPDERLDIIGGILGHRDPETTSIYTRAAVQHLRRLALPVPT